MVENGKPQPDIYLYACQEMGELPENCMAVEDSPNGVRSAASAGLVTVMVPDLTQPDEEISRLLSEKVQDLGEIPGLVRKMNLHF